jgi:hypothetical protein
MKPQGYPKPCGGWKSPDATGLKTLWIRKQSNTKQKNISDNQQPLGDKQVEC